MKCSNSALSMFNLAQHLSCRTMKIWQTSSISLRRLTWETSQTFKSFWKVGTLDPFLLLTDLESLMTWKELFSAVLMNRLLALASILHWRAFESSRWRYWAMSKYETQNTILLALWTYNCSHRVSNLYDKWVPCPKWKDWPRTQPMIALHMGTAITAADGCDNTSFKGRISFRKYHGVWP